MATRGTMRSIGRLFDGPEAAARALRELEAAGFHREALGAAAVADDARARARVEAAGAAARGVLVTVAVAMEDDARATQALAILDRCADPPAAADPERREADLGR